MFLSINLSNISIYLATRQSIAAAATTTITDSNHVKPAIQYANADSLPQSVLKTVPSYENIPTLSSTCQNNIEMNQCTAYGVLKEKHL